MIGFPTSTSLFCIFVFLVYSWRRHCMPIPGHTSLLGKLMELEPPLVVRNISISVTPKALMHDALLSPRDTFWRFSYMSLRLSYMPAT